MCTAFYRPALDCGFQSHYQPTNQPTKELTKGEGLREAQFYVPLFDQLFLHFNALLGSKTDTLF
jgi:hypothetical protein